MEEHDEIDPLSAELLAEVFRTAPLAMQLYRLEDSQDPGSFRMVATSPGSAAVSGVEPEAMQEHVGKTFREFIPQFAETPAAAQYLEVIRTGRPATVEFVYGDNRYRARAYAVHAWRLRDRYLALQYQDVTDRQRMQKLLEKRVSDLQRSNTELDHFATAASHDLQEPLRTIASFADLLVRDHAERLDDKGVRYLSYVQQGAARLQLVLDGLLEYARLARRPFTVIAVRDAIDAATENLSRNMEELRAEVEVGEMPTIHADPNQLTLLFLNLMSNALRFAGDAPPKIEIDAERRGDDWHFRVRDQGIGFDPTYAEKIFEMFRRLHSKDAYPGTGIGLASCKKIVEAHGGKIWAESVPGRGATFHFTLPETHLVDLEN